MPWHFQDLLSKEVLNLIFKQSFREWVQHTPFRSTSYVVSKSWKTKTKQKSKKTYSHCPYFLKIEVEFFFIIYISFNILKGKIWLQLINNHFLCDQNQQTDLHVYCFELILLCCNLPLWVSTDYHWPKKELEKITECM